MNKKTTDRTYAAAFPGYFAQSARAAGFSSLSAITRDTETLKGRQFKVDRYDCVWTVLCYERNSAWTCQESDYNTTCQFYESEILAGLLEAV
jgi:hypothetical protein